MKIRSTFGQAGPRASVKIGVLGSEATQAKEVNAGGVHHSELGLTLVEVATFNEFGTERIPERSFIRGTVDTYRSRYVEQTKQLYAKVCDPGGSMTVQQALAIMGMVIQGDIQARISAGIMPANAPSTVRQKGSSTPLIDTGQLRQSIRYKVEG